MHKSVWKFFEFTDRTYIKKKNIIPPKRPNYLSIVIIMKGLWFILSKILDKAENIKVNKNSKGFRLELELELSTTMI